MSYTPICMYTGKSPMDGKTFPNTFGVASNRAARTLLNLRESWGWATREERKMLVRTMIQEAGCDVESKRIMWVKVNPDYEILFRLMDGLQPDAGRRYWIKGHS